MGLTLNCLTIIDKILAELINFGSGLGFNSVYCEINLLQPKFYLVIVFFKILDFFKTEILKKSILGYTKYILCYALPFTKLSLEFS